MSETRAGQGRAGLSPEVPAGAAASAGEGCIVLDSRAQRTYPRQNQCQALLRLHAQVAYYHNTPARAIDIICALFIFSLINNSKTKSYIVKLLNS